MDNSLCMNNCNIIYVFSLYVFLYSQSLSHPNSVKENLFSFLPVITTFNRYNPNSLNRTVAIIGIMDEGSKGKC